MIGAFLRYVYVAVMNDQRDSIVFQACLPTRGGVCIHRGLSGPSTDSRYSFRQVKRRDGYLHLSRSLSREKSRGDLSMAFNPNGGVVAPVSETCIVNQHGKNGFAETSKILA